MCFWFSYLNFPIPKSLIDTRVLNYAVSWMKGRSNMFGGILNIKKNFRICILKGTVSVISSDPPFKDGNVRFTTVTLKTLFNQVWIRYQCLKLWNFQKWVLSKNDLSISMPGKHLGIIKIKYFLTWKTTISSTLLIR